MKKRMNNGLCFLRVFMSFEVVLCHFWIVSEMDRTLLPFEKLRSLAVPVFMFMSFVLTGKTLTILEKTKMNNRFRRLLLPQIIWAFIYWGIYYILKVKFQADIGCEVGVRELIQQIFLGHSINETMWYQVDLIIITGIMTLVCYLTKEKVRLVIMWVMLGLSLIFQYSGINAQIFTNLSYEVKYPLGRLCEMIPYAVVGFFFSYYGLLQKMEKYRWNIIVGFSVIIFSLLSYSVFIKPEGYGYSGIDGICMAILLVSVCYLIPFYKLPGKVNLIIEKLSKYTLGIYCIHRLIRTLLVVFLYPKVKIEQNTFQECILVYVICYLVVILISKIPFKWCKDIVV